MAQINHYQTPRVKRALRVRSKLFGTTERPRLSILRSNKHTSLQAIDDVRGVTVASVRDEISEKTPRTKTQRAVVAAEALAKKLKQQKVTALVIDRGSYRYLGRVQAVTDALRNAGVEV